MSGTRWYKMHPIFSFAQVYVHGVELWPQNEHHVF